MFDTMLNVMSVTTNAPTDEELGDGAEPQVLMTLVPAVALPLADPTDPSRPIVVPVGNLRFRLDGEAAVSIGEKLAEEGRRMPRRSRVEIASSVSAAEEAARRVAELRG